MPAISHTRQITYRGRWSRDWMDVLTVPSVSEDPYTPNPPSSPVIDPQIKERSPNWPWEVKGPTKPPFSRDPPPRGQRYGRWSVLRTLPVSASFILRKGVSLGKWKKLESSFFNKKFCVESHFWVQCVSEANQSGVNMEFSLNLVYIYYQ